MSATTPETTATPYEQHPVYKHFEAISRIPHGSGNEAAISGYIMEFARELGLEAVQDASYNLVVRKPAAEGYENAPVVILQGHLDMVCEKNMDIVHDFERDPLRLVVEGDMLRAEGTTLGADDGVAVAYMMALMEDATAAHPALELVFTADEEVGLVGAAELDGALLRGDIMVNLDSGEEGVFLTSCAGGLKMTLDLPLESEAAPDSEGFVSAVLRITGLVGGHSGIDIDRGRGNSILLAAMFLRTAMETYGVKVASLAGGSKDNAIPREAEARICIPRASREAFAAYVRVYDKALREKFAASGANAAVQLSSCEAAPAEVLTDKSAQALLALLEALPNGVLAYSEVLAGLVETSNNVGVVCADSGRGEARIECALRSSVAAKKKELAERIRAIAEAAGASIQEHGAYPAWEYNPDSKIRRLAVETYEEMSGKRATLLAVHAGLECGLFAEKRAGLDMIAFGPDMFDIHSPQERLSLSSFVRTWDLLLAILARITE